MDESRETDRPDDPALENPATETTAAENPAADATAPETAAREDAGTSPSAGGTEQPNERLEELLEFIRDARGFDFTGYKRSSLARRIRKRMSEVGIEDWIDYRDRLEIDADEFRFLFNTILINVTSFFRDIEAWNYLQREVLPDLLSRIDPDREIRVWSAGCSSGEEAYSLAIAFAEAIGLDQALERVKIYGTDVDDEALRDARAGTYSAKKLEALPASLRDKYFEPNGAGYSFRTDLRRRVIFGRHDLTRDAPISRLDLLACRNTLMYFNVEAQRQIVDRLHYALNEDSYLFLGKAEMLLSDAERFDVAHMRQRIFRRRPGRSVTPHVPVQLRLEPPATEPRVPSRKRVVSDLMVESSPFATIGLDDDGVLIAASVHARTQFGISAHDIGKPFRDHELSYRPVELRSLIEQAHREHRSIHLTSVERRTGAREQQFFDIVVQPLWGADATSVGTAVTFIDTTSPTRLQHELKQVREDLETAYEELQSTNEELETTNEELQSSIEELETTNEELQSTNEELETTNEELQSGNEELETMNEEMGVRTAELDGARAFLEGVLSSVAAGVVVIDRNGLVQGWNRAAEDMWGMRATEVAEQSFFSLEFGLPVDELRAPVDACLRDGRTAGPIDLPAVNRKGRTITCRVVCSPLDGATDGAVLLMEEAAPN